MAASAGTIWFWMDSGGAAATSLVHDRSTMRVLITMTLSLLKYLPALP